MEEKKKPKITAGKVVTAIFILLIAAVAFFGPMYGDVVIDKINQAYIKITDPKPNTENSQFVGTWQTMTYYTAEGFEITGNDRYDDGSILTLNPDGTYTSKWYGSGKWWETDTGIKLRETNETNFIKFTFKEGYILDGESLIYTGMDGSQKQDKYGAPYVRVE